MAVLVEKTLALLVAVANVLIAAQFPGDHVFLATMAGLISIPGVVVIWFREGLSYPSFARGVSHSSPPLLVGMMGWLALLFFPVWFAYRASLG